MTLLQLEDVVLHYGKIEALHGLTLNVEAGEVVALIGANGAGKTSTMRAISGIRGLHRGRITFDGQDVTRLRADQRMRRGLCLAPEGRGIFPGMTVAENLDMGAMLARTGRPSTRTSSGSSRSSRACRSAASSSPARCRVASSRCSPSAGHSCHGRGFCSSTSPRWVWPRC